MFISSKLARTIFQTLGATIGLVALCLQFYLTVSIAPGSGLTYLGGIIVFFGFMTILTNILVVLSYLIPLSGRNSMLSIFFSNQTVLSGILVYIFVVGIAYHFLLADQWNPKGLALITDLLLHYIVPCLYFVYWILFVKKGSQKFMNSIKWLVYPLLYIIYILIRGAISGLYPYHFIDVNILGYGEVFKNIFFLMIAYIVFGIVVVLFDKFVSTFINMDKVEER
ncbi:MAG: Pr6Pr family membrane protein [Ignavibacteria bacterium]